MIIHADTLIRENGGNTTLFGRIYADLFDKKLFPQLIYVT